MIKDVFVTTSRPTVPARLSCASMTSFVSKSTYTRPTITWSTFGQTNYVNIGSVSARTRKKVQNSRHPSRRAWTMTASYVANRTRNKKITRSVVVLDRP